MNRENLIKKLITAKQFCGKGNIVPAFSNVNFNINTISTYNGISGFSSIIEDVGEKFAINCDLLINMLSSIKNDEINFEKKDNIILIHKEKSKIKLVVEEPIKINVPDVDKNTFSFIITNDFINGLKQVSKIIDKNTLEENKKGVTFNLHKDDMSLYATNNICIYYYEVDTDITSKTIVEFIIPEQFVNFMIKNCSEGDAITITENSICVNGNNFIMFSALSDIDTVDYNKIISETLNENSKSAGFLEINDELKTALKQAVDIQSVSSQDKMTEVEIVGGIMKISTSSYAGSVDAEIEIEDKDCNIKFKVITKLFNDIVNNSELITFVKVENNIRIISEKENFKSITATLR